MTYSAARCPEDDELESWVIEELEAISRSFRSQQGHARPAKRNAVQEVPRTAEADEEPEPTIGAPADESLMTLFDEAETTFIERSAEWLRERPNADMILEEIWRAVVGAQAGEEAEDLRGEAEQDEADPGDAPPAPVPSNDGD